MYILPSWSSNLSQDPETILSVYASLCHMLRYRREWLLGSNIQIKFFAAYTVQKTDTCMQPVNFISLCVPKLRYIGRYFKHILNDQSMKPAPYYIVRLPLPLLTKVRLCRDAFKGQRFYRRKAIQSSLCFIRLTSHDSERFSTFYVAWQFYDPLNYVLFVRYETDR